MMNIEILLSKMENKNKAGDKRWHADCPVCGAKMSIKECEHYILIDCRNCPDQDILKSVSLLPSVLFGDFKKWDIHNLTVDLHKEMVRNGYPLGENAHKDYKRSLIITQNRRSA